MRYMFERKAGMALVGLNPGERSGADSRAAGAEAPAKEEKKEEAKTEPLTHLGGEIVHETDSPVTPTDQDSFQFVDPNPARVAGTRRPPVVEMEVFEMEEELADQVSNHTLTVRDEAASRGPRVEIDEDQATPWGLKLETVVDNSSGQPVAEKVDSIKGSRMEEVLDYDRASRRFSYKTDKAGKRIGRDLTDHDVLGYALEAFGITEFAAMSEGQQKQFWDHIQSLSGDPLERLSQIERLIDRGPYARNPGRVRGEALGDIGKSYDPSNPENRTNEFTRRLDERGITGDERTDALARFAERGDKSALLEKDVRDILRTIDVDTSARSFPEQIEKAKEGQNPGGRQKTDKVEESIEEGREDLRQTHQSEDVREQRALAGDLGDRRSERESLDRHPELIDRASVVFSRLGATGVPADTFDSDLMEFSSLALPKDTDDTDDTGFETLSTQYGDAVRTGDIQEEERLWQELRAKVAEDKLAELEPKRDAIKAKLADWYSPERVAAHKEAVELESEMRAAGVPEDVTRAFAKYSTTTSDGVINGYLETGLSARQAALDVEIKEKEKKYREIEGQTHYERKLRKQIKRERDYADYISAVYNAETDKATRLARRITGDRDMKISRSDYTDEGLTAADTRRRAMRNGPAEDAKTAFDNAADFLGRPGAWLGKFTEVLTGFQEGVDAVNTLGEALGLKMTATEAAALLLSIKEIFKDGGVGERGFKRENIVGSESNFAKYEKKEPAADSAGKELARRAKGTQSEKPWEARKSAKTQRLQQIGQGMQGAGQMAEAEGKDKTRGKKGSQRFVTPGDFKKDWENLA